MLVISYYFTFMDTAAGFQSISPSPLRIPSISCAIHYSKHASPSARITLLFTTSSFLHLVLISIRWILLLLDLLIVIIMPCSVPFLLPAFHRCHLSILFRAVFQLSLPPTPSHALCLLFPSVSLPLTHIRGCRQAIDAHPLTYQTSCTSSPTHTPTLALPQSPCLSFCSFYTVICVFVPFPSHAPHDFLRRRRRVPRFQT